MPHLEIGKFRMHYEVLEGALPEDTLFIHGNFASNAWWHPTILKFPRSPQGKYRGRAILAEWRGCGDSSPPLAPHELKPANLAADYIALLDHLEINTCHLVGHSAGGLIAFCALASAQDRFIRALLLNPVSPWGLRFRAEQNLLLGPMRQHRDICARVLLSTIYKQDLDPALKEKIVSQAFAVADMNWEHIVPALSNTDVSHALPSIQTPCLVLHGKFDNTLPPEDSERAARLLPRGQYELLAHQGHSWNLEDPEKFSLRLHQFLYSLQ